MDDVIVFDSLTAEDMRRVVKIEVEALVRRAERVGITLDITPRALLHLATEGYDERYGARSLRRLLVSAVEQPLSQLFIEGEVESGERVVVELRRKRIVLRIAQCRKAA